MQDSSVATATGPSPIVTGNPWLDAELLRCADDPDRFNSVILARRYTNEHGQVVPARYWSRQREVCRSITRYRQTVVPSGNGVGKTFAIVGLALWAFNSFPGCKVVVSAPTIGQLQGALWGELEHAIESAARRGVPLGGRVRSLSVEHDASWRLEAFGSGSIESKSGRHAGKLFAFIDEASGTPGGVDEAIDSLNPSCYGRFGNPLRPEGKFYTLCEQSGDNPHVNRIRIPSTESPDIHLARSPRGMADATWLEDCKHQYGEDSIWWLAHVLAQFPGTITEGLLPIPWLTLASETIWSKSGDVWLGVDIGEGGGGDPSVIIGRDDNGVPRDETGLAFEESNRWDLEQLAERTRAMVDRFDVDPTHIVFDQNGIGADFENRLRAAGLPGCKGFKGSRQGGDKFANLRSATAWRMRQRFDPKRAVKTLYGKKPIWTPQHPFSFPRELLDRFRAEFQGLRYQLTGAGEIALEVKEEFVKRLKKSPNVVDAFAMTFAYPYA